MATRTQITTTVQAFTCCDPSGRHIVTILPPTAQVCTAPAVPLSPADPLGSQLFAPASSTRDLLDGAKGGRECGPLPLCRWNLADFAREKYAPLLLQTQTKVGGLGLPPPAHVGPHPPGERCKVGGLEADAGRAGELGDWG